MSFENLNRMYTKSSKWDMQRIKHGEDIIALSVADSDYKTCDKITDAIIKRAEHGAFGYTYCDNEYYEVLINWFKNEYGYNINPESVIITPGILVSLGVVVRVLCDKKVLINTPVYYRFHNLGKNNNKELVINKLKNNNGEYSIDFVDLENKLKEVDLYVLCNPHNPVGRVWTYEEIKKIVDLCKKHDVILVSDEIHCDLVLFENKFTSVGKFIDVYDKIIIATAPSKTFNIAGLQLANTIIPNNELLLKVKNELSSLELLGPNLFGIYATITAYKDCKDYLVEQNKHIENNYLLLKDFFNKYISNAIVSPLEGTYLAWIDMSFTNLSSTKITNELAKYKLIVSDGIIYGTEADKYIRVNLACSKEQLMEGLNRIKNFIDDLYL